MSTLLDVQNLRLSLPGVRGVITPVDGVGFTIAAGESVGLVGESGCGKSLSALTLLGLTSEMPGARVSGSAKWHHSIKEPKELLHLSERMLTEVRGGQIAMVFQDPLSSLNPLLTIEYQLGEVTSRHCGLAGKQASQRAVELLSSVGIPQPEVRVRQYPHQLSGGLRQRVMLAMALAGEPQLLIADEPTTALDVTIQAQILCELKQLMCAKGLAVLFITHDLGVVAQLCSRVLVMYAGRIVEEVSAERFFSSPLHPYSRGLLASLPSVVSERNDLTSIRGVPPRPDDYPNGCRFHPRCPLASKRCRSQYPDWVDVDGHRVACWEVSSHSS